MTGFEMSGIKAGDIVEIKSGGPGMVVVAINPANENGDEIAVLTWYCESICEFRNAEAPISILLLVKSAD